MTVQMQPVAIVGLRREAGSTIVSDSIADALDHAGILDAPALDFHPATIANSDALAATARDDDVDGRRTGNEHARSVQWPTRMTARVPLPPADLEVALGLSADDVEADAPQLLLLAGDGYIVLADLADFRVDAEVDIDGWGGENA